MWDTIRFNFTLIMDDGSKAVARPVHQRFAICVGGMTRDIRIVIAGECLIVAVILALCKE